VVGSAFPAADGEAVERMLTLTRRLELLWLVLFVVTWAGWQRL
jgi:hypothetical protein